MSNRFKYITDKNLKKKKFEYFGKPLKTSLPMISHPVDVRPIECDINVTTITIINAVGINLKNGNLFLPNLCIKSITIQIKLK